MTSESFQIPFADRGVEHLSALFEAPEDTSRGSAVLLAHGAGFHMRSPFLDDLAAGLVERGFPVLRFNYPYRERALVEGKRNRPPDPQRYLEAAHELARAELERRCPDHRLLLSGKSLGARIASYLAAKDARCAGMIFFGYPLHAPGRQDKLRAEHFPAIVQPALFLQGTRDDFCDLGLLRERLRTWGGTPTVHVVDDADHGFKVRKKSGRTNEAAFAELLETVDTWERTTWP